MKDLDPAEAVSHDDLIACLQQLYVRADRPSLRELELRTAHLSDRLPGTGLRRVRLGRSAVSEMRRGVKFPKKAFMLTFVEACGVDLHKDRRWEQAWDRLAAQYQQASGAGETEKLGEENKDLRRQLTETRHRAEADLRLARAAAETRERSADHELAELREQLVAAKLQAETAERRLLQEQTRAQTAEAQVGMAILRATAAEYLLDRELSGSGFASVTMPQLDGPADEGTVTRWLKEPGDRIQAGEPLIEVANGSGRAELPAPVAGIVRAVGSFVVGKNVAVGTVLAVIDEAPDRGVAQRPGGSVRVSMPRLGESVTEGTVLRWLKREGERIEVDEPLLEVSTDKVDTEIPSPASGILHSIAVDEDETVAVGAQLAVIEETEPGQHKPSTAAAVIMPRMDETVHEGTVTRWLKREGERVEVDEPLLEVSIGMVYTELPSPASGILGSIMVDDDETVAVGKQLAVIETQPASDHHRGADTPSQVRDDDLNRSFAKIFPTPVVRQLADRYGVNLANVAGTGVGGRIRRQDVIDAARALQKRQPGI